MSLFEGFAALFEHWDRVLAAAFLTFLAYGFLMPLYEGWRLASAIRNERRLLEIDEEALKEQFHLVTARPETKPDSPARLAYDELVRLGDWTALHARLRDDEASGAMDAQSGQRAARTGVNAAMADLHTAVGHGGAEAEQRVIAVIDGFETRFDAAPNDPAAAVLAAEAHMELGWLYRGGGTIDTVSAKGMERMQAHFQRAEEIIRSFEVVRGHSALMAATNFRLQVGLCNDEALFHSARAIWLKADPSDPEMMRQVAFHLLPRWYGSYPELHRAAAEIANLTRDTMGDQAYAMTLLSVAMEEPELVEAVDAARLLRGAVAMIEADGNDLETINYVASCLFCLMMHAVGTRRVTLRQGLRDILQSKMRGFLPDFWPGSISDMRLALAPLFGQELNNGAKITIDEQGFHMA